MRTDNHSSFQQNNQPEVNYQLSDLTTGCPPIFFNYTWQIHAVKQSYFQKISEQKDFYTSTQHPWFFKG